MRYKILLSAFLTFLISLTGFTQPLLVVVQQAKGVVAIYDVKKHQQLAEVLVGYKPHEITYDPISRLCYVSNFGVEDYDTRLGRPGNSISIIDPFRGKNISTLFTTADTAGDMPHGLKVRPGKSRELFVNIEKGDSMFVYSLPSCAAKRKFALPSGTHNFIFSKNGQRLWLMTGSGIVAEINPENGKVICTRLTSSPVRGLNFIGNDLLASGNNELSILSQKDLSVKKHFDSLGVRQLFYSSVSTDGKLLICPAAFDHCVLLVDAVRGNVIKKLSTDKTPLQVQGEWQLCLHHTSVGPTYKRDRFEANGRIRHYKY